MRVVHGAVPARSRPLRTLLGGPQGTIWLLRKRIDGALKVGRVGDGGARDLHDDSLLLKSPFYVPSRRDCSRFFFIAANDPMARNLRVKIVRHDHSHCTRSLRIAGLARDLFVGHRFPLGNFFHDRAHTVRKALLFFRHRQASIQPSSRNVSSKHSATVLLSGIRTSPDLAGDDDFAARGTMKLGAWILGRNMFGPIRGPWKDESWKGWWGPNPPYHVPVFVLTHHARPPITMEGGTTFHFVTEGIEAALRAASTAAGNKDVRLGGGVATIREYLKVGLVDEMHLAISPVLLGTGEHLLSGLDLLKLGYRVTEHVPSASATHIMLTKSR